MMKTKSFRIRKLEQRIHAQETLLKTANPESISVTLDYKINRNEITFRLIAGKINTRVKRNLKEVYRIEEHVLKYLDSKMPEMRNLIPVIEKPELQNSKDYVRLYEKRLMSIDNFLQTLAETPELWSRDILIFLGIDKYADQSIFIQKKHESIQNKRRGIRVTETEAEFNPLGLPFEENLSYTNNSQLSSGSFLIDSSKREALIEEITSFSRKSPSFPEPNNQKSLQSTNKALKKLKEATCNKRTVSGLEFKATIKNWREKEQAGYIEYVIRLEYLIGDNNVWEIAKRYSDFVYIHKEIQRTNDYGKIPTLPPKIYKKTKEQLDLRKVQLEDYLNSHLSEYPINPLILEFCEFKKPESEFFKQLLDMHINSVECDINGKDAEMTKDGDVITYYEANFTITPFNESLEPLNIKTRISYEAISRFYKNLIEIAEMGDIDVTMVNNLPEKMKTDARRVSDQELMDLILLIGEQKNHSLINLFIFKKFLIEVHHDMDTRSLEF